MESYLQAVELADEDASSAAQGMRREWFQTRDISADAGPLPELDWSSFHCVPDHPGLVLLRSGSHKKDVFFPPEILSPLPSAGEALLSWAYLLRGGIAQLDQLKDSDPSAWEVLALDLSQVTEHFRRAPRGSHVYWLGHSFQAALLKRYGEGLEGEKAERTRLHADALWTSLADARERSQAIRNNRVAQLQLVASDEPVCWRWSEGVLPLLLESRIGEGPQGFFWDLRSRRALKNIYQDQEAQDLLAAFWEEAWVADDLLESLTLMTAPFLMGRPLRSWERWQMDRFVRLRED